jgi:hypothetical protein
MSMNKAMSKVKGKFKENVMSKAQEKKHSR